MKTILDVQQDVRNLEVLLGQLTNQIARINKDLNILREEQNESLEIDYKQIEQVVQCNSLKGHPIRKLRGNDVKQLYLSILLAFIQIDSREIVDKLIFVTGILEQAHLGLSLEELIKKSLSKRDEILNHMYKIKGDYKYFLILDMLIILGFTTTRSEQSYTYVAHMCGALGIEKEKVYELLLLSRVILEHSVESITAEEIRLLMPRINKYKYYIDKQLKQEMKIGGRAIVVKVSAEVNRLKWKVQQKAIIKKGDLVAIYKNKNIYAPADGMIYQFRKSNVYYGVISGEDDTKEAIKEWLQNKEIG